MNSEISISDLESLLKEYDWHIDSQGKESFVISSFDFVRLISDLEATFRVSFQYEHMSTENFSSIDKIYSLLVCLNAKS